jgi:hypothetical protein
MKQAHTKRSSVVGLTGVALAKQLISKRLEGIFW